MVAQDFWRSSGYFSAKKIAEFRLTAHRSVPEFMARDNDLLLTDHEFLQNDHEFLKNDHEFLKNDPEFLAYKLLFCLGNFVRGAQ